MVSIFECVCVYTYGIFIYINTYTRIVICIQLWISINDVATVAADDDVSVMAATDDDIGNGGAGTTAGDGDSIEQW